MKLKVKFVGSAWNGRADGEVKIESIQVKDEFGFSNTHFVTSDPWAIELAAPEPAPAPTPLPNAGGLPGLLGQKLKRLEVEFE